MDTTKPTVSKEETFDKLEIRLGVVLEVSPEPSAVKPSYKLTIDFGKFGRKTSVARLTQHSVEDLKGKKVVAVLNFEPRKVGEIWSEVLVLGVQFPKADSGEATVMVPLADAKIGGKLF